MRSPKRDRDTIVQRVLIVLIVLIIGWYLWQHDVVQDVFEDVSYAFDPSAARAYEYGSRHFNSLDRTAYDIDRAERFFVLAVRLDPKYPYVNHELARIAFLRGHFDTALWYIDKQISIFGESEANSYYIRGLIEGYMGRYADSATDYKHYLEFDPHNWAAINDYSWVLLKAGRARDAVIATTGGLAVFPDNAWLLNSNAIALYELGHYDAARIQAAHALKEVQELSETEWLVAYPGNDPAVADEGLSAFKDAAMTNMHTILLAGTSSKVQLQSLHE